MQLSLESIGRAPPANKLEAVTLFSGIGGCCTGAEQAGACVIWAANHWRVGVEAHAANHPWTEHLVQDLHTVPHYKIPDHDLLIASPSCKGWSPARGKARPLIDEKFRATAGIVVDVMESKKPEFAIIENVPEFESWARYESWIAGIHALGYSTQNIIWDAADSGVPQHRVRIYIICSRSKNPVDIRLDRRDHVPISTVLQWDSGKWSSIFKKGRSDNTLTRIANGIDRGLSPRFIAPYYGSGSGLTGRNINRPIGTLTTKARWMLVDLSRCAMRMLNIHEAKLAMGFPPNYILPPKVSDANIGLGNAVCPPVMQNIVEKILAS